MIAGITRTLSSGLNFVTTGVSKTYNATYHLIGAGLHGVSQFGPMRKITEVCSPFFRRAATLYPDWAKFSWSTGTALTTTLGLVLFAIVLKRFQPELSKTNNQIKTLDKVRVIPAIIKSFLFKYFF